MGNTKAITICGQFDDADVPDVNTLRQLGCGIVAAEYMKDDKWFVDDGKTLLVCVVYSTSLVACNVVNYTIPKMKRGHIEYRDYDMTNPCGTIISYYIEDGKIITKSHADLSEKVGG